MPLADATHRGEPSAGVAAHNLVAQLYADFGQRKPMGGSATHPTRPHFYLLRRFLTDLDLLVILSTKRCRYRCEFCNLPAKSSVTLVPTEDIVEQFLHVCREVKDALSVIDRVTLSNEGSILDFETLPCEALECLLRCISEIRSVRRIVLETRLEYAEVSVLRRLREVVPLATFDILTGFETLDGGIRRLLLAKSETLEQFGEGLDRLAAAGAALTCYVLLKPDPRMTDDEAVGEAEASIEYLQEQTNRRGIALTVRLNLMYAAEGTPWAAEARVAGFVPPRLSDALAVAKRARERGVQIYIGLSSEGLAADGGTYEAREDFSRDVLREAKRFNNPKSGDGPTP